MMFKYDDIDDEDIVSTKIVKTCEYCGKEFQVSPSLSNQRFCSRECYEESKKPAKRICPICHKAYTPKYPNQKTCSKSCSSESFKNREICTCDYCGKEFERKKSDVKRSKAHFCSKECRYNAIKWKKEDIQILKENYGNIQNPELQGMLSAKHSIKEITRKALELGIGNNPFWTEEENQILRENYGKVSMEELMKLLPKRSKDAILDHAHSNHILSPSARLQYTEEEVQFIKDNYLSMSNAQMAKALGRTTDGISLKLYDLGLTRPFDVKASSYPDLEKFVRRRLSSWIDKVRAECNYTCSVTGSKENIEVHHIRSFNLLMEETVDILDFPEYENFSDYSEEQLELFVDTFLELQESYHSYTCVKKDVHKLFHMEYGYGDNTQEQWDEFVEKYKNGYYNNVA